MRISDWSSDVCSSDLGEGLMLRWPNRSVFRVLRPLVAAPDTSGATRGRDGLATEPEGGAAMTKYAGLDVSMEETAICVIDGDGRVVAEAKVATEPAAIAAYLARWSGSLAKVGLEAGSLSPWLWHALRDLGLPVVCMEARRLKAYAKASPVKTDRRDAKLIALALRAGLYRAVHVKSAASQKQIGRAHV